MRRLLGHNNRQESQMLFDLEEIKNDFAQSTPKTTLNLTEGKDFNFEIGENSYKVILRNFYKVYSTECNLISR